MGSAKNYWAIIGPTATHRRRGLSPVSFCLFIYLFRSMMAVFCRHHSPDVDRYAHLVFLQRSPQQEERRFFAFTQPDLAEFLQEVE